MIETEHPHAELPVITAWAVVRESDMAVIHCFPTGGHARKYAHKYGGTVVELSGILPRKRKVCCNLCGNDYEVDG